MAGEPAGRGGPDAGRTDRAADGYAHAFALACQLGDPCWEGISARGSGLVEADAGDVPTALGWIEDACARCTRWPDAYQWVHGYVLDAGVPGGAGRRATRAQRRGSTGWPTSRARGSMREFVVRSYVHQAQLGQAGAAEAAPRKPWGIDNPVAGRPGDRALSVGEAGPSISHGTSHAGPVDWVLSAAEGRPAGRDRKAR